MLCMQCNLVSSVPPRLGPSQVMAWLTGDTGIAFFCGRWDSSALIWKTHPDFSLPGMVKGWRLWQLINWLHFHLCKLAVLTKVLQRKRTN